MPTVKITATQTVYYEKTLDLPQDEYELLLMLNDDGGIMIGEVMQFLADSDSGFTDEDIVESERPDEIDIETIAR